MKTETQGAARPRRYMNEATHCFAVPGALSIVDVIHPDTGRSWINDETLEQIRERYPAAEVVEFSAWIAGKAAMQDRRFDLVEVTAETYEDMLNVLPPEEWRRGAFLVGEPSDHHAATGAPRFACYVKRAGKVYATTRPLTRAEFALLVDDKPQAFGAVEIRQEVTS